MSNGGGHFADLPVLAFDQFERNPAIGNSFAETNGRIARRDDCRVGGDIRKPAGISGNRLRLNHPRPARQSFAALDDEAALKIVQFFGRRNSFDLDPILALMGAAGMKKFLVQTRFIAQQEEPFGVGIEPANGPYVLWKAEPGKSAVTRAVAGELRQHAKRLVKCENQGPVRALWFRRSYTAHF